MEVINWFKRLFTVNRAKGPEPIAPGLYHARREAAGQYTRFHLRVELDGSGMVLANATAATHLTPTGVVIVKGLLDGKNESAILRELQRRYQGVTKAVMEADIARVKALIETVTQPGDHYPIFNLEDAMQTQLIAPLQATLPLAEIKQLRPVLERLWAVGIPHVLFLAPGDGPDSRLWRDALVQAVERAEDLGMIAGVRAPAQSLVGGGLLDGLTQAGLDHVTLPYIADAALHDALLGAGAHAAFAEVFAWLEAHGVCAVAEIPLLTTTLPALETTIAHLLELGSDALSFVAYAAQEPAAGDAALSAAGLVQVAAIVDEAAHKAGRGFIWNPPVQRHPGKSLATQVRNGPRCSGDVAVRVEPDGAVIPARGPYRSAGNLLRDPWPAIWNHEVFRSYRERIAAPTRCEICPGMALCAADCPREMAGWALELE